MNTFKQSELTKKLLTSLILLFVMLLSFQPCNAQYYKNQIMPKEKVLVKTMPSKSNIWVFVMAGQSNMEGRGMVEPQDTIINKRIIYLDENQTWCYAKEPLHSYSKLYNLDCGKSFAESMLKSVPKNVTIALLPCAVGGTSVEQWLGDNKCRGVNLYSNFKKKINIAKKVGTIKGIIWHQGESDSDSESKRKSYSSNLEKLIKSFRSDIGDDELPFVMGEICIFKGLGSVGAKYRGAINTSLHQVNDNVPNTEIINTQGLNDRGDRLHFNTKSVRIMGERFGEKMSKLLGY